MKELKIRYTFKRKSDKHIYQIIASIESIEQGQLNDMLNNELWELISRDLYTGFKDKEGKEIYEGDILDAKDGFVYFIKWNTKEGKFEAISYDKLGREILPWNPSDVSFLSLCEVIGNIYELQKKNKIRICKHWIELDDNEGRLFEGE